MNDIRRVRVIVNTMLDAFFNHTTDVQASDWKIYAGISDKMTVDLKPPGFKDAARALRLKIVSRYAIITWKEPVRVLKEDETYFFKLPADFEKLGTVSLTNKNLLITLTYDFKRRADLVVDNEAELLACDFPYTGVATALNPSLRQKIYMNSLSRIRPPMDEDEVSTGFWNNGSQFFAAAADKATYGTDTWTYYPKWLKPSSKDDKDRMFNFDNLSDEYLQNNFKPYDLQINFVYLYFSLTATGYQDIGLLMQADVDLDKYSQGSASVKITPIIRTNVPDVQNLLGFLNERLMAYKKANARYEATITFFYSVDGSKDEPEFFKEAKNVIRSVTLSNLEQVIDPQYMVQQIRSLPFYKIENEQKQWEYGRWLKELVRLRFSEKWVWFTNNSSLQMFYTPDRNRLFLDELRAEFSKAEGPVKEKLQEFLKKAEADQSLLLVKRGWKYGKTKRIVGSDDNYVYIYHNAEKVLVRLPMYAFWKDVNIMQISSDIYDQTKWIIPFAKIVVWGSLAVMTFAIAGGTQTLSWGFRTYVEEKIKDVAVDAVLKAFHVYEEIVKRLKLMLINGILSLFPSKGDNKAFMVIGFMRGFITGYVQDSFNSMFQKWHSLAKLEPSSIKTIKLVMRVEAGVSYFNDRISYLKPYLDLKTSELLMNKFVHTFSETASALVGIINNVYYLEYEQAKDFLQIFTDFTGRKPLTKKEWNEMRHKRYLKTFRSYADQIKEAGVEVKEMYGDIKKYASYLKAAVIAVEAFLIVEVATGGLLVAMIMYALAKAKDFSAFAGKQLAIYVLPGTAVTAGIGFALSDEFRDSVFDVVKDIGKLLDKGLTFVLGQTFDVERMQRLGTFVGHLWGGISLNKAVLGKDKKWTEKWKTQSPARFLSGAFLRKEMSVSPILPVIKLCLFNYVILIEDVVKASKKEWDLIQDDIAEILKPPEEFADFMEEDNNLTVVKILKIIIAIETRVASWMVELSKTPELTESINKMIILIDKATPDKLPSFKDLQNGKDLGEWSREAFMFVVLSHLHTSLKLFQNALEGIYTGLPGKPGISISNLLEIVGFQLNEEEANEILDRDFDKTFGE